MDGRGSRLAAALAAASVCVLGIAGAAQAAEVTAKPPLYTKPNAGPFTWRFVPNVPGGRVAWKLSSETAWHRCTTDTAATFGTLPEGSYTIAVADDVPGCSVTETDAPGAPVTQAGATIIDGTPPVVTAPVVTPTGLHERQVTTARRTRSRVSRRTRGRPEMAPRPCKARSAGRSPTRIRSGPTPAP